MGVYYTKRDGNVSETRYFRDSGSLYSFLAGQSLLRLFLFLAIVIGVGFALPWFFRTVFPDPNVGQTFMLVTFLWAVVGVYGFIDRGWIARVITGLIAAPIAFIGVLTLSDFSASINRLNEDGTLRGVTIWTWLIATVLLLLLGSITAPAMLLWWAIKYIAIGFWWVIGRVAESIRDAWDRRGRNRQYASDYHPDDDGL